MEICTKKHSEIFRGTLTPEYSTADGFIHLFAASLCAVNACDGYINRTVCIIVPSIWADVENHVENHQQSEITTPLKCIKPKVTSLL